MTSTATTTGTLIERLVELAGPEGSVHLWVFKDFAEVMAFGLNRDRFPELDAIGGSVTHDSVTHDAHGAHGAKVTTQARTLLVALQSAVQIMSTAPTYGQGLRLVPRGGA